MKLLFPIIIFFFVTISICNALRCINTDEPIYISKDFTFTAVQQAIKDSKWTDEYKECNVFIWLYYDQKIIIQSGTYLKPRDLHKNHEVFFQTIIEIVEGREGFEEGNIINKVKFVCNNVDECDRRFILDRLEWLLKVNYAKLVSDIRPLSIDHSDNTENECFDYDQKETKLCSDGMCSINYIMSSNSTNGECVDGDDMITKLNLESRIITDPGNNMTEDEHSKIGDQIQERFLQIHYRCGTNNCNNRTNAESLVKAVEDHYDLPTVHEVFKVNIKETTTATPTDNSTDSTTTTTTATATTTTTATAATTTTDKSTYSTTKTATAAPTDKSTDSTTTTTEKPNNTSTSLDIFINMMIFIDLLLIFRNFLF